MANNLPAAYDTIAEISAERALRDKDARDEKHLEFVTDLNQRTRV